MKAKKETTTKENVWRAPHVGIRVVTISFSGGIDVLPDALPLGPDGYTVPKAPEMLAISPTAPLVPGQRIAVLFKSKKGERRNLRTFNRDYDCIFRFVKETPKRFYISTAEGNSVPPLDKSTCIAHAVVGVFRPEGVRS